MRNNVLPTRVWGMRYMPDPAQLLPSYIVEGRVYDEVIGGVPSRGGGRGRAIQVRRMGEKE